MSRLGGTRGDDRRGSALLVTMLTAVLVSGLAGGLVIVLSTEQAVEANHRRGVTAFYAADGLLAGVTTELMEVADWRPVFSGSRLSSFGSGPLSVRLADGAAVDLPEMTLQLQRETDAAGGPGPGPLWRLFAWGWFADLLGDTSSGRLLYVAAWISDGGADQDPDQTTEATQRIVVRATAFGPFRARRSVEASLGRTANDAHVVTWDLVY